MSASANPRHYLHTVLLYFRHVSRFLGSSVFTSCDHVLPYHASSCPRPGYDSTSIYPDFILLHCITLTGLETRACIVITIILLFLGIRAVGPKPFHLVIVHHVFRAKCPRRLIELLARSHLLV